MFLSILSGASDAIICDANFVGQGYSQPLLYFIDVYPYNLLLETVGYGLSITLELELKILKYHYQDSEMPGWTFDPVEFGQINLLVGDSATGKTRFLNTISNLGRFVGSKDFKGGSWDLTFEHQRQLYSWKVQSRSDSPTDKAGYVIKELLAEVKNGSQIPIIERDGEVLRFRGKKMPKLSRSEAGISLFEEEAIIQPIFQGFASIQSRSFSESALSDAVSLQPVLPSLVTKLKSQKDLRILFEARANLSVNLYMLNRFFKKIYLTIIEQYQRIFPFIEQVDLRELSNIQPDLRFLGAVPVFSFRERNSEIWIPINQCSSGMQKVLLILTDLFILPDGGVYIIDEYENSLGLSAIDFFPQFVLELEKDLQFFVASHHPYIINAIPPNNWYVFHRNGMHVSIEYGQDLVERFGRSKQQAFIQLINDPYFYEGVE